MPSGLSHHYQGECAVEVGLGSGGALSVLGYSVDGCDWETNDHTEPVNDDRYGPRVPADEQSFLSDGTIHVRLIWYDETVRSAVMARADNGVTEGVYPYAGRLYGAQDLYYPVLLNVPATSFEEPFYALNCRLLNAQRVKLGTKAHFWDLSWYFKGYSKTSTTTNGLVLYNRTGP
jgi:hypothetical protein